MSSYQQGKTEVKWLIARMVKKGARGLDVGACDGVYWLLLHDIIDLDAVEIYEPNIERNDLVHKYGVVYNMDIKDLKYDHYDVVIFGDVIEHMTVEDAQATLAYAQEHADLVIVAVPYRYRQGPIYGNPWERHIQDDLTHEIFMQRYPGFKLQFGYPNYGYYISGVHGSNF